MYAKYELLHNYHWMQSFLLKEKNKRLYLWLTRYLFSERNISFLFSQSKKILILILIMFIKNVTSIIRFHLCSSLPKWASKCTLYFILYVPYFIVNIYTCIIQHCIQSTPLLKIFIPPYFFQRQRSSNLRYLY